MFNFNPLTIPNLALWLDANDPSTINNGRITDGGTVSSFRDKINNLQFKNVVDGSGPTYSFGMVNGKNVINFQPVYQVGGVASNRALGLTNLSTTTLNSATSSIFCVYVPTEVLNPNDTNSNEMMIFTMEDNTRFVNSRPGFANRMVYLAEDKFNLSNGVDQRKNPSPRYLEADITSSALGQLGNYQGYVTYHEHVPNRNFWQGITSSVNKLSMIITRVQDNIKKCGFVVEKDEFLDDFSTGNYIMKNFPLPNGGDRGIKTTGKVYPIGNPIHLCLGAFRAIPYNYGSGIYPFKGYFCELLYFNRFLDDDESSAVRKYLYKKWFSGKTDLTPPPIVILPLYNDGDVGPGNLPYVTGFTRTSNYTANSVTIVNSALTTGRNAIKLSFTGFSIGYVFTSNIDFGTKTPNDYRFEVEFLNTSSTIVSIYLNKNPAQFGSPNVTYQPNIINYLSWDTNNNGTTNISGVWSVNLGYQSTSANDFYIFSFRIVPK